MVPETTVRGVSGRGEHCGAEGLGRSESWASAWNPGSQERTDLPGAVQKGVRRVTLKSKKPKYRLYGCQSRNIKSLSWDNVCKVSVSEVTVESVPSEQEASYTLLSAGHQVAASHSQCSGKLEPSKLERMGLLPTKGQSYINSTRMPQRV